MNKTLTALTLLSLSMTANATSFVKAGGLYQQCGSNNSTDQAYCLGVLSGVVGTEHSVSIAKGIEPRICLHEYTTLSDLSIIYMEGLSTLAGENTDTLGFSASSVAYYILATAYPCK